MLGLVFYILLSVFLFMCLTNCLLFFLSFFLSLFHFSLFISMFDIYSLVAILYYHFLSSSFSYHPLLFFLLCMDPLYSITHPYHRSFYIFCLSSFFVFCFCFVFVLFYSFQVHKFRSNTTVLKSILITFILTQMCGVSKWFSYSCVPTFQIFIHSFIHSRVYSTSSFFLTTLLMCFRNHFFFFFIGPFVR